MNLTSIMKIQSNLKMHIADRSLKALLHYKYRDAVFHGRSGFWSRSNLKPDRLVRPIALNIETTSRCNSGCIMCPRTVTKPNRKERLTSENIKAILRHTPHLIFQPSSFGEPLLDRNISNYILYAHNLGSMTRLITNASLLDCAEAWNLMSSGLDILSLSIHASDKETYQAISPGLRWGDTLDNAVNLKGVRKLGKFRTYLSINVVRQEMNNDRILEIVRFWIPYVDTVRVATATRHWKDISETFPLRRCMHPWNYMLIYSNGDVPLCLRDVEGEYVVGNVLKNRPIDIWNKATIRKYRRMILSGNHPEICHKCDNFLAWEYFMWGGDLKCIITKEEQ